jgi:hypothetical protein
MLSGMAASCGGKGDANWVPPEVTPADPRLYDPVQNPLGRCVRPDPQGDCLVDPAPAAVSCSAAEAGLEFLAPAVFDFNAAGSTLYSYTDGSSEFLWPDGYEPALFTGTAGQPPVRCKEGAATGEGQLHLIGGPFREWGGGMGRSVQGYATLARTAAGAGSCVMVTNGITAPVDDGTGVCPPLDPRIEQVPTDGFGTTLRAQAYDRMLDLREWDGISFWARRGVGSDAGFRVGLADRQLDDDMAYLETEAFMRSGQDFAVAPGPSCGRVKECGCRNHRPCTLDPVLNQYFCYDPARGDIAPNVFSSAISNPIPGFESLVPYAVDEFPYHFPYEWCGTTTCDEPNDAFEANVNGGAELIFNTAAAGGTAECLPYTFNNDFTADYCYDPNDTNKVALAPNAERCGVVWARPVTLTPGWAFYKIPFNELLQEGWGKDFPYLDLSRITVVRFTFPVGWIDFWLDDVRFYRARRAAPTAPTGSN